MYSVLDLQKLVQMLNFLGFAPNIAPAHYVVIGGGSVAPGAAGTLFASNGAGLDPSYQSLASLNIQPSLGYTPAHSGANTDITSLAAPALGAATATTAAHGISTTQVATTAFVKASGVQYPSAGIAIVATTTLTLAQLDAWAIFAGSFTATMPSASSAGFGTTMTFSGGSLGGVIKGGGSDTITASNGVSANTQFVPAGQTVTIAANGSGWYFTATGKISSTNAFQNIADYGGIPDGTTDNSAAFIAALTASPVGSRCVFLGPGNWSFAATLDYTFVGANESVTIIGAGADLTVLTFPNSNNGFNIAFTSQYNSIHVRDMTVATGATGQTGLNIVQTVTVINPGAPISDITNVNFRQAGGYTSSGWWGVAIELNKVSNFNITNVAVTGSGGGTGVQIDGASGNPPVNFNFQGCNFLNIPYGMVLNQLVQGVTVNQCNFSANTYGISTPASVTGLDQLTISNSQFNCMFGLYILSEWQNLMVSHNLFIVNNAVGSAGIYNSAAVMFVIVGNTFQNNLGTTNPIGIYLNNTLGVGGVITGNLFRFMGPAISLDTATGGVNVQSNAYFNNSTNVSNLGTGNTIGGGSP